MLNQGYDVHVACLKREGQNDDGGLNVHEYEAFYPSVLNSQPTGIWSKLMYRMWLAIIRMRHQGGEYDRSVFAKTAVQNLVSSIIGNHNIQKVFVTCAPFYLASYLGELKKQTSFFLTTDFRDPWTWGKGYGYSLMSDSRKGYDKNVEAEVMSISDLITTPSEVILDDIKKLYPNSANKLYHLPHAFEKESFDGLSRKKEKESGKLKFIYAGTLYEGFDEFISSFIEAVEKSKVNERVYLDIYSDDHSDHGNLKESTLQILFHNRINEKALFEAYMNSDAALVFFPEKFKDFISTKFFELAYAKLPIVLVGYEGLVSRFILENNLGAFIPIDALNPGRIEKMFAIDFHGLESHFDASAFEFSKVTSDLVQKVDKEALKKIEQR